MGSVVGIATAYGLDGPGIESQWGAIFSAPIQIDPGAHIATCTMGTGSFPGVNIGRSVTLTPHPLLALWLLTSRTVLLLSLWDFGPVQSLQCLHQDAIYLLLPHIADEADHINASNKLVFKLHYRQLQLATVFTTHKPLRTHTG